MKRWHSLSLVCEAHQFNLVYSQVLEVVYIKSWLDTDELLQSIDCLLALQISLQPLISALVHELLVVGSSRLSIVCKPRDVKERSTFLSLSLASRPTEVARGLPSTRETPARNIMFIQALLY